MPWHRYGDRFYSLFSALCNATPHPASHKKILVLTSHLSEHRQSHQVTFSVLRTSHPSTSVLRAPARRTAYENTQDTGLFSAAAHPRGQAGAESLRRVGPPACLQPVSPLKQRLEMDIHELGEYFGRFVHVVTLE